MVDRHAGRANGITAALGLAFSQTYVRRHVRPDPLGKLPPGLESIHPSVRECYARMDGYRTPKLVEFLAANPQSGWKTAPANRVGWC